MPRDPNDWSFEELLAERPTFVVEVDGRECSARIVRQGMYPTMVTIAYQYEGREHGKSIPWPSLLRHFNKKQPIYI